MLLSYEKLTTLRGKVIHFQQEGEDIKKEQKTDLLHCVLATTQQLGGLVKVCLPETSGCGFNPHPSRTKDCEIGPHYLPAWHSVFGVPTEG